MRITVALHKALPHLIYRVLRKQRRSLKLHEHPLPRELLAKNVPIYDGYKFSREREAVDFSKYLPLKEKVLQPEFAYKVSDSIRLTEGDAQVQLLTNSLYHKDMPPAYLNEFDKTSISDSESAWISNRLGIMQHDSFQVKLPKVYEEKYHWVPKERPYGPPIERKCRQLSLIFNDFVRLTSGSGPTKPTLNDLTCQYMRPSATPYVFHGTACSATLSSKPLPLIGDPSVTGSLPSMYPAAPEMDLEKTYEYDPRTISPIDTTGYNLHTVYINHPYDIKRTRQERSGIALLQTFAFVAARAATGKKPLVVQTVYHDEKHVDFVVMQLNTLHAPSGDENEVRNEIWHVSLPLEEDDGTQQAFNSTAFRWLKVFYGR